ncbi:DUF5064 family protein [Pseudomonas sp. NPDC007930]|uniref:DUF5064 family protein n=1 Tax=Pseudomonas sp. NPDC007930 TaxID=3364417 RepID=UPI0036E44D06
MYQPGHLHLEHIASQPHDVAYHLDIRYDVQQGSGVHFTVQGSIAGKPLDAAFDLPRDLAYNFASEIDKVARKHGLPKTQVVPVSLHKQYDEMFEDIRHKLNMQPGECLSPERLDRM